jgi:hypothetical protein
MSVKSYSEAAGTGADLLEGKPPLPAASLGVGRTSCAEASRSRSLSSGSPLCALHAGFVT